MIVDTSNEIGGDGDIPHAGIGNARRMQVPDSDMQHKVWCETQLLQLSFWTNKTSFLDTYFDQGMVVFG